jgi:epoxyqueuosine reductase
MKENIPQEMKGKFDDWFLNDLDQDVPWNKFSKPHNQPLFNLNPELLSKKILSEFIYVLKLNLKIPF